MQSNPRLAKSRAWIFVQFHFGQKKCQGKAGPQSFATTRRNSCAHRDGRTCQYRDSDSEPRSDRHGERGSGCVLRPPAAVPGPPLPVPIGRDSRPPRPLRAGPGLACGHCDRGRPGCDRLSVLGPADSEGQPATESGPGLRLTSARTRTRVTWPDSPSSPSRAGLVQVIRVSMPSTARAG